MRGEETGWAAEVRGEGSLMRGYCRGPAGGRAQGRQNHSPPAPPRRRLCQLRRPRLGLGPEEALPENPPLSVTRPRPTKLASCSHWLIF